MKVITSLLFAICLAAAAFSQSPSKVLKQAEKALGGTKVLQTVRSTMRVGTIRNTGDNTEGKYAYYTSQPNLISIRFDLSGFETEYGYNGRSGWTRNSRDGLATLTGKDSLDLQTKALFRNNLWLRSKDEKSKIVSGGQAMVDGKSSNVVILTTRKGPAIKLFFDAVTGLPVRDEMPSGDTVEISEYSDYRDVGGTKQPFAVRVTQGEQIYEIRLDDVKINQAIAQNQFDFPVVSNAPLPDIQALLRELHENQEKVEAVLERYSFTQKIIERELTKEGALREKTSETFQLSFYKGNRVRRLVEKNGKQLTAKEQNDADKDAEKQVEEIEKRLAKEESRLTRITTTGPQSQDTRRISIAELLRASKLINPRRERFRGRDVVVFDFEPDPAFDTRNAKSMLKFFGKTTGVMWIDEQDKQVARIEAALFESLKIGGGVLAKLQKGASFTLEQERVNDEIWLPSQADINLSVRVLLVKGVEINQVIRSYDYRRFETEVKDAKITETKKP